MSWISYLRTGTMESTASESEDPEYSSSNLKTRESNDKMVQRLQGIWSTVGFDYTQLFGGFLRVFKNKENIAL
ncbi:hypothetical protein XELAEV_18044783mg [Xenopus laevis]|uniref:Uncharacterized protein n=1 Tax=Xenopus laevis TaxID=8355 RepID=A0A974BZF1_XENLA|nr:hypothetical protein XELAEV_18044783mg [Xenopus laevis]